MSGIADELVARYIMEVAYRRQHSDYFAGRHGVTGAYAGHLATCESTRVEHPEARDGLYGCDTGCEYMSLEADIVCDHGYKIEFEYGDFGDTSDIIHWMTKQEGKK